MEDDYTKLYHCPPLRARLTEIGCAANAERALDVCSGCPGVVELHDKGESEPPNLIDNAALRKGLDVAQVAPRKRKKMGRF